MILTALAYVLVCAPPVSAPPPVLHDWRAIGGLEFERSQGLEWPGLYQLQLLGPPELRTVTRLSIRRARGFGDFSVVSVSKSMGPLLPGRSIGNVAPARGTIWAEVAVRLPRLPARFGSRFLFRGGSVRPSHLFLSGRF